MAISNRPVAGGSVYDPAALPAAQPQVAAQPQPGAQVMYSPALGVASYGGPGGVQTASIFSPLKALWEHITAFFHRQPSNSYQPAPVASPPAAYPPLAYPPVYNPGQPQLPGVYQPAPSNPVQWVPLPPVPVSPPPPPPPPPPAPAPPPVVIAPPPPPAPWPQAPADPAQQAELQARLTNLQAQIKSLDAEIAQIIQLENAQHPGSVNPANPHPRPHRRGHGPELRQGATGRPVRQLQRLLRREGLYQGTINAKYDAATVAAVKQYQKKHHLTVDGIVGPQTWGSTGIAAKGGVRYPQPPASAVRAKLMAGLNNPYKGVVHQCFRYAWSTIANAGGKSIGAAPSTTDGRGNSVSYLATMAQQGRLHVGDVVYVNYNPGTDPSSTNLSNGPHWFVYLGNGQYGDQYGIKQSADEMQNFVPGRKIDTIYHCFG